MLQVYLKNILKIFVVYKEFLFIMLNRIENKSKFLTFLLAIFFLATPIDYILPHFGNATVLFVLGIAISLFLMGSLIISNVIFDRDQVLIVSLIVVTIVSFLWAEDTDRAFSYAFSFIATALMYLLLFFFKFSKDEIKKIETASIIGGIIFLVYVFTQVDLDAVRAGYRLDLSSVGNQEYFSDPNGLAARLVMPTVLMIKRFLEKDKLLEKLLYGVSLGLIVYIIFLTGSRAAVIMLASILLIVISNFATKSASAVALIVFLILVAIIYVPDLLPEHIYNRIFNFDKYQEVTTLEGDRIDIWKNVLFELFPNSPLWGYGIGNASLALAPFYGRIKAVHNSWLIVLVDLGLIGFIPWIALVFEKLKQAFKIRKKDIYVLAVIVGVIVMASTLDSAKEKYLWNGFLYVHMIMSMYDPTDKTST